MKSALRGLESGRVPCGPLAVHYCARVRGVSIREYTTNPRTMAECVIRYYERFCPDAVWLSADTWVSAEAMGAKVAGDENQPVGGVGPPLIQSAKDIDRIPSPEAGSQGRYPLMLEALRQVVEAIGKETFVVACFDQYPFSLAAALMGVNETMVKVAEDRPMIEALMERCLEYGLAYAKALSAVGADMLSGGDSPAGLVGPTAYRELALPFEKRLIRELKASVPQPVSLHICGRATPLLADMSTSGADILEIDHLVNLGEACRIVPANVALWGNLDPVGVLAQGTPDQVRSAARKAIQAVQTSGRRGFVLSSGCTLAMETPPANLDALLKLEI